MGLVSSSSVLLRSNGEVRIITIGTKGSVKGKIMVVPVKHAIGIRVLSLVVLEEVELPETTENVIKEPFFG